MYLMYVHNYSVQSFDNSERMIVMLCAYKVSFRIGFFLFLLFLCLICVQRYKTIDNCLRNRYRRWTLDDLVEACSDALYDMEGITKGVCARTVQMDIQIMRSDKLGYNAPIEVYDRIYYRYADPEYSITEMPLSIEDCKLIKKAIILLENKKDKNNEDTIQVLNKVQDRLKSILNFV